MTSKTLWRNRAALLASRRPAISEGNYWGQEDLTDDGDIIAI